MDAWSPVIGRRHGSVARMKDWRTGADSLRVAVTAALAGGDTAAERAKAVLSITAADLDDVIHAQFEAAAVALTSGLGASPGAGVGKVYFSADDAADAADRGEDVVLVRNETTPADVHGMMVANGLLTTRGGLVSHAAVVARGWGTPAVVGADTIVIGDRYFSVGGVVVAEGDVISIDGATGDVVLGEMATASGGPPEEFFTLLSWADEIRAGHLAVRANADTGDDAMKARELGAVGIGLCRTEHMFLAVYRLPVVRRMILARDADEEGAALEELGRVQQADFEDILRAMDSLPVTVRLLDPPLHEFLPPVAELTLKEATEGLSDVEQQELRAARTWAEHNPMIGTRGVRLGVLKPGLYAMQVRALLAAVQTLRDAGLHPIVEVMIPLTVTRPELALARSWVEAEIEATQSTSISVCSQPTRSTRSISSVSGPCSAWLWNRAGRLYQDSRWASVVSMGATRLRSSCSTRLDSTMCRARRTGCPSLGSLRRRRFSPLPRSSSTNGESQVVRSDRLLRDPCSRPSLAMSRPYPGVRVHLRR